MIESHVQRSSWPNRWVGGKFNFIPHNLLLELSMTLAHRLKKSDFLGWFLFLHTQILSLKQLFLSSFGFKLKIPIVSITLNGFGISFSTALILCLLCLYSKTNKKTKQPPQAPFHPLQTCMVTLTAIPCFI